MSDVVEKTLASLPSFLSQNLLNNVNIKSPSVLKGTASSRAFQNFIKNVGNASTQLEEDQLIKKELCLLQQRLGQPDVSNAQMRDYLTRLVYCKSLGYDVSFCYVHALKSAHQASGFDKRMGYMASALLLHENHECMLLFISTLQRDLKSTNFIENCMALSVAGSLINTEMIPMLLPSVLEKLNHKQQLVRMKAVMCLHQFYLKAPALLHHCHGEFNKMLCDKDPGVVTCALHLYHSIIKERPEDFIHLGNPMIKLLNMVILRKISTTFDYHSIPSPWLQILILKILAILGSFDEKLSISMSETLLEVLERSTIKENIAIAIMYECIETITKILPQQKLLEKAVKVVGGLLHSANHNFRYLGLKALQSLTKINSKYSVEYQMLVVECLEESDPVIQRKTFDLLLEVSSMGNIELICNKLLGHISKLEKFQQAEIISKISDVVLLHPTKMQWYVEMVISMLDSRSVQVPEDIVDKVLTIINKGFKDDPNQKDGIVTWFENCITDKENSSSETVQIAAWVLGQHGAKTEQGVVKKLFDYFCKFSSNQTNVQNCILCAVIKLINTKCVSSDDVLKSISIIDMEFLSVDLQQRLKEMRLICLKEINLPHKIDGEIDKMDFTLSFLDDFVSESLESGDGPYMPTHLRFPSTRSTVVYEADYESIAECQSDLSMSTSQQSPNTPVLSPLSPPKETRITDLNLKGVPKVWSKEGVLQPEKPASFSSGSSDSVEKKVVETGSKQDTQAEDKVRKQELAAALFGHINTEEIKSQNDVAISPVSKCGTVDEKIILKNADSGIWKKIHESAVENINCDVEGATGEISPKDKHFQSSAVSPAHKLTVKDSVTCQSVMMNPDDTTLMQSKKHSIYDEHDFDSDDG